GGIGRIGKEVGERLSGDDASGRRPAAGVVLASGDLPGQGDHRTVSGQVIEAHVVLRERTGGAFGHPGLTGVSPGRSVILRHEQPEVGADLDPVGRVRGEVNAELVREGPVGPDGRDERNQRQEPGTAPRRSHRASATAQHYGGLTEFWLGPPDRTELRRSASYEEILRRKNSQERSAPSGSRPVKEPGTALHPLLSEALTVAAALLVLSTMLVAS